MKTCSNPVIDRLQRKHPEVEQLLTNYIETSERAAEYARQLEEVKEVLEFYGSPMTYFAIGIFPDQPCGEFIDDYSEAKREVDGVVRQFPGARARAMLSKLKKK